MHRPLNPLRPRAGDPDSSNALWRAVNVKRLPVAVGFGEQVVALERAAHHHGDDVDGRQHYVDHRPHPRPHPVVAESLVDRLINASHQVIMNGPSSRPNKRPKSPADPTDPKR
ncbi:hypothetical protein [Streptomyces bottropensis]|uniref:hypothetical protein n=1 Tax=Streptomyces bottropensis TaxID=42235 RepID=UPI0036A54A5A